MVQESDRDFSCFMVDVEDDTAVAEESLRNVAPLHPREIQSISALQPKATSSRKISLEPGLKALLFLTRGTVFSYDYYGFSVMIIRLIIFLATRLKAL